MNQGSLNSTMGLVLIVIMAVGSLVDIFQAMYIGKRMWRRWKRNYFAHVQRDAVFQEYQKLLQKKGGKK